MITLTAPMVKKLDQLLAGGGGGGGGSTDLTPVLDAIAAIPAPSGGSVDLTPVLSAVAAVDSKAVAVQTSVAAIPTTSGGSAGSQIKSIQRLNISVTVAPQTTQTITIASVDPSKTQINVISSNNLVSANINVVLTATQIQLVNAATSTSFAVVLKVEIIENV